MPVVHSSASALSTAGVLTGHGPSSNVSTTSLSPRKSSCLKCSKPKPGPPVVSISTARAMPSALGLAQLDLTGDGAAFGSGTDAVTSANASGLRSVLGAGAFGGAGTAAACWALSGGGEAGLRIHIAPAAHTHTVPATSNPATIRITRPRN